MKSFLSSRFRKFVSSSCLLLAVSLLTISPAQASVLGARIQAARIFDALSSDWHLRSYFTSGLLKEGQSTTIRTTFYAGCQYKIVAGGCEDAFDVDLAVYNERGQLVARDSSTSPLAVADLTANWTGTVYIKVTMHRVRPRSGNAAHYVVQYAYR